MVKGGLKRKKADKAKNQLKVSKKGSMKARTKKGDIRLPKGLNITDATFKTKKIVLLNQGPSSTSKEDLIAGLVTKKKLGLKELLSKLNNLSVSTRLDGLEGLNELLASHQSVIDDNLSIIITRLVPFLTERESKLRRPGVSLLESIFTKVNSVTLEPLFSVICAHLCCGLSHIDDDIQLESVRFLDSIVESQPQFIVHHINQILPNCLNQITASNSSHGPSPSQSKMTTNRHGWPKQLPNSSNAGASVRNHFSENISTLQWRFLVIERIRKMLSILQNRQQTLIEDRFNTVQKKMSNTTNAIPANDGLLEIGLYVDRYGLSGSRSIAFEDIFTSATDHVQKKSRFSAEATATQLFPILLVTWSEAISETQTSKHKKSTSTLQNNIIHGDTVPILISVVKTMQIIFRLAKQDDCSNGSIAAAIKHKYGYEASQKLIDKFPYEVSFQKQVQGNRRKQGDYSKALNQGNTESAISSTKQENYPGSYELNLCIISCFVELLKLDECSEKLTYTKVGSNLKKYTQNENETLSLLEPILIYLNGIKDLRNELKHNKEGESTLTEILQHISTICINDAEANKLFNCLVSEIYSSNPRSRDVVELISYLVSIQSCNAEFDSIIRQFITDLPQILISENASDKHLETIRFLLKRNDKTLTLALLEVMPSFPGKLDDVIKSHTKSGKDENKLLLKELWKTLGVIFFNPSIVKYVQNQEEQWKTKLLSVSTNYSAHNDEETNSYKFYRNAILELQS